jgi:hypothetical protein
VTSAADWRKRLQEYEEGDYAHKSEANREAEDALHDS